MREGTRRRWKRWGWRVALLVLVLLAVQFVGTRLAHPWTAIRIVETDVGDSSEPSDSSAEQGQLTVLAYNIAHGRGPTGGTWQSELRRDEAKADRHARLLRIADWLAGQNADVVVLNEVDFSAFWTGHRNYAAIIAERAGYRYRVEHCNYDAALGWWRVRHGNVVLSRLPVVDAQPIAYPAPSRWERWVIGSKQGLRVTLSLSDGREVHVIPVHLESGSPPTRLAAAKAIDAAVASLKGPVIAAGDFNSRHDPVADPPTAVTWLFDAARFTRPAGLEVEGEPTFPADAPTQRIDWILATPNLRLIEQTVVSCPLSDHLPVWARFELP